MRITWRFVSLCPLLMALTLTTFGKSSSSVTLASSVNPSTYGASVKFTATVTPSAATGTVTFKDGTATLGTGAISSGKATFSITTLGVGSHSITAAYGGDANYNSSASSALTQVVNKANSSVTVASSVNPSVFGASVKFTATLAPLTATGSVTFKDGTTSLGTGTISSGKATFSISTLASGSHSITAAYGGDTNYNGSTSSALTETVNKANSTVTLFSSANPSVNASPVTFTAVVPRAATGTVTFKDGTTTLGTGAISSGTATFSTSTLALGSHSTTAVYGGDSNYNSSTSSVLTQTVKQASSVTLTSSANPSVSSVSVTFTATVTPSAATGTMTFKDGGTTLGTGTIGGGKASFATSTLAAGSHSMTAVYGGNSTYVPSTSAAVTQNVLTITSIAIFPQNSSIPLNSKQQYLATATLSDGSHQNVTSNATWTSSSTSVATIDITGLLSAPAQGQTTIQAALTGSVGVTSLNVTGPTFWPVGSLITARFGHTATLLPNGKVLIVGGQDVNNNILASAELYDPASGTFSPTAGSLRTARESHTATLLANGKVLIAGGMQTGFTPSRTTELYDPATGTFTFSPNMNIAHSFHTAASLSNGMVLIAGGGGSSSINEIYDPNALTFTPTGNFVVLRSSETATLLNDTTVLAVGGIDNNGYSLASSELYDPVAGTFSPTGSLGTASQNHTATLLTSGKVLVAGGYDSCPSSCGQPYLNGAVIFDPATKAFMPTTSLTTARNFHTATRLNNGSVLVVGGQGLAGVFTGTAELFDQASQSFLGAGSLATPRVSQTATLLNDGTVLIVGGQGSTLIGRAEIYSPTRPTLSSISMQVTPATANMQVGDARQFTAVDNFGNPRADVTWMVSDSAVATVGANSAPTLTAVAAGTVTLTASSGSVSSQAQVTVAAAGTLSPGSVDWTLPPVSGFTPLQLVQAVPSHAGPDLYSIQLSSDSTHTVVQAATADGQGIWETSLPVVNGNSVPDGFGGLLVTEHQTCNPNQTDPMTIVDLDGTMGQPKWQLRAAAVQNGSTLSYCYPDDVKWVEPQMAIRVDGSVVISAMTNNGLPPLSVVTPGGFLQTVNIPTSTATDAFNNQIAEFSPMSPPIVDSDGSIYVEYEVRQIAYPPKITSAVLYLLKIGAPLAGELGQQTTVTLSSTSEDKNLLPGRIIPDGQGGVLATWTISPSVLPIPLQVTHSYQAAHVVSGAVAATYDLPFTPLKVTFGLYPTLVLGENGTAFATDGADTYSGPQIVSFNLSSGAVNWSHRAALGNALSIIGATANGSVATIDNSQQGILQFDASGGLTQITTGNASSQPSYSWKGHWNAFSALGTSQFRLPFMEDFASLWANPRGSPSNNGAAGRPWYFILNWQNVFDFIPDKPSIRPDLKADITGSATAIKAAALDALQQAYKQNQWSVVVVEGTPNTGDHQAVVQTTSTNQGPSCGSTNITVANPKDSEVWYECNMEQAQWALQISINTAQDESNALTRQDLIQAIGRGIGNTAAHEIAHQFLLLCCSMDVLISDDSDAAGTYNNGSADGDANPLVINSDPAPYTGYGKDGTPIHWENSTKSALDKCLGSAWTDFGGACAVKLKLQ
jgi:hypothetical protein